jgi:hypothetical protein
MRTVIVCWCIIVGALFVSCGKAHTDLPTSFKYNPPPTPTDLVVTGGVERSSLAWDYPAEAFGALREFRIYYYYAVYEMVELVGTSSGTSFVDSLLVPNLSYCYEVSAVDTTGFEGWRTAAKCAFVRSSD